MTPPPGEWTRAVTGLPPAPPDGGPTPPLGKGGFLRLCRALAAPAAYFPGVSGINPSSDLAFARPPSPEGKAFGALTKVHTLSTVVPLGRELPKHLIYWDLSISHLHAL